MGIFQSSFHRYNQRGVWRMYLQLFGEGSLDLNGLNYLPFAYLQPAAEIPKSPGEGSQRMYLWPFLVVFNSYHRFEYTFEH